MLWGFAIFLYLSATCFGGPSSPILRAIQHCNLTESDPLLEQLKGTLFAADKYYFSLCGFIWSNNTLTSQSLSDLVGSRLVKHTQSNSGWVPIISSQHTLSVIHKGNTHLLRFTPIDFNSSSVVIELSCAVSQSLNVLIDDVGTKQPHILFVKLSHTGCQYSRSMIAHIVLIIALTLMSIVFLYCLLRVFYNKWVYKQSWSDSIPHFRRSTTSILRLRTHRRTGLLEPHYVRLPTESDEPKEEEQTLLQRPKWDLLHTQPIVLDNEPQDDLLSF